MIPLLFALITNQRKPPLDMFGSDAVESWFTEREVDDIVKFVNRLEA